MEAWAQWIETIKDNTVENIGFKSGGEISKAGTKGLDWNTGTITGLSIINTESLDDAEKIASSSPYISSIRVYEVMENRARVFRRIWIEYC